MLTVILTYLSVLSPLLPITIGIRKRKSLLWLYAVTGFLFDILMNALDILAGSDINTDLIANVFLPVEFLFIAFYYKKRLFRRDYVFYTMLAVQLTLFILLAIYITPHKFNNYGAAIFDISSVIFAIIGLYSILQQKEVYFLGKLMFFWVNVAFVIYGTGNFLIFLADEYLSRTDVTLKGELWPFHNILNIIFSTLVAIALSRKKIE